MTGGPLYTRDGLGLNLESHTQQGHPVTPEMSVAEAHPYLPTPMKRHLHTCGDCKSNPSLTAMELTDCCVTEIDAAMQKLAHWGL